MALYALYLFDLADNESYRQYSCRSACLPADLRPLRAEGTRKYLWWLYERLEDLRPLFWAGSPRE